MNEHEAERLLERYSDSLTDDEALAALRPQTRERVMSFAAGRANWRRRNYVLGLTLGGGGPLAIAACVVFLLWPRQQEYGLVMTIAGSPEDLFVRAGEAGTIEDRIWIGLEVTAPCWIHLVERTKDGGLFVMRPQASSDAHSVQVTDRLGLGPFQLIDPTAPDGPSRVTHILVIASAQEIPSDALAGAIPDHIVLSGGDSDIGVALRALCQSLAQKHGWEVQYTKTDSNLQ